MFRCAQHCEINDVANCAGVVSIAKSGWFPVRYMAQVFTNSFWLPTSTDAQSTDQADVESGLWGRSWREDRRTHCAHMRRVRRLERRGLTAKLSFVCDEGTNLLAINVYPDCTFAHLLRPRARQHYTSCGWQLHITIGIAATCMERLLWESFVNDWADWHEGHSYHFDVLKIEGGSCAILNLIHAHPCRPSCAIRA